MGKILLKDLIIVEEIGGGSYSTVYLDILLLNLVRFFLLFIIKLQSVML
jgi:hypothetical protein